ncbi:hypothetical protein [Nonomuraea sp. NPDC052265]|uniref:hypothetical protein n=1 Tax=Nonomuraea sp. NPDC052265 TaxID=3364374 RepID=UPI0037CC5E27
MAPKHGGPTAYRNAATGLDSARQALAQGLSHSHQPDIAATCFAEGILHALVGIGDALQANTAAVHDGANLLCRSHYLGEEWAEAINPEKFSSDDT